MLLRRPPHDFNCAGAEAPAQIVHLSSMLDANEIRARRQRAERRYNDAKTPLEGAKARSSIRYWFRLERLQHGHVDNAADKVV